MTVDVGVANRWHRLRATAKTTWGRLTDDQWLLLEGRRESRTSLFEENPSFAKNRRVGRGDD